MLTFLANPLNLGLTLVLAYLIERCFSQHKSDEYLPPAHAKVTLYQKMTPRILQKYNGVDKSEIYLAVRNKIYDVSNGKGFYGPDGPYGNFAGRDASRGLAKHSFDEEMLTPVDQPIDSLTDLTEEEIQALDDWEKHFRGKYQLVGELSSE